jgi:hypothetical protein
MDSRADPLLKMVDSGDHLVHSRALADLAPVTTGGWMP